MTAEGVVPLPSAAPPPVRPVPSLAERRDVIPPACKRREALAGGPRGSEKAAPANVPILDLHGLSVPDALSELGRFFDLHERSARMVRLIPGRGSHSGGDAAVRDAAERWLDARGSVAWYRRGRPGEGGDGVLWVRVGSRGRHP